ncbi:MAG: PQQ-binding-like beta-propeller repeat protein [Polyangiales bacterium]
MNRPLLAAALALAVGACMPTIRTTTAFSSRYGDNDRAKITQVIARVPADGEAHASNPGGRPLLAAVTQSGERAVVVYDLSTRQALWTTPLAASSTPEIVGDAVVVEAGTHTAVLDLATGRVRGQIEHRGLEFVGVARDGDTLVMSFASGLAGGSTRRAGRVTAVSASSAAERWTHTIGGIVGRPAAAGGLAFVPWDRQSVAVLDLATGVEQARLRSTDDVLSWVFVGPGGVHYGGRGIYRLTPDSATGTRAGSAFLANPLDGVPGDPQVYRDAFLATTGSRTARDKIRFGFRTQAGEAGHVNLQDGAIYLAYYHDLVAVDAATGAVRWAQRIDDDVEALQVTSRGVFVASGNGKVRAFDPATGAVSVVAELGAQVGAIDLDLEGFARPDGGTAPEGTVREQLVSMIREADNRLVPFRSYLVGVLARREEEEVTRDLLDLYSQRSIPAQLRQSVATALQARRSGAQFLVAALGEHYDYLEGRQAPPLQVIAPALVQMGARDAVPGLLSHLLDHETPAEALPQVINAVATLGEASVVPTLRSWIQLYKYDSAFGGDRGAPLAAAAEGVFRHGDAECHDWLRALQQDQRAHASLRARVDELFTSAQQAARAHDEAQHRNQEEADLQAALNTLHEQQAAVPGTLTDGAFDEVWNTKLDEIRGCAQGAVSRNPELNQIRVVVTLRSQLPRNLLDAAPPARTTDEHGGTPHATTGEEATAWVRSTGEALTAQRARVRLTTYSPNDTALRTCMDAALLGLEFPVFREGRQEFRRVIDTRAGRATAGSGESLNGLGVSEAGLELPWWLVSAPTLAVENPVAPAPTPTPGTRPQQGTAQQGNGQPGTAPRPNGNGNNTQQGNGQPGTAAPTRPWWEE